MNCLVVGTGSIGRRHIRNLRQLGLERLSLCDRDPSQVASVAGESNAASFFLDFEQALGASQPDIVFVCSPPVFHVPQALLALRAGAHVFIEKPLSHDLNGVEELMTEAAARHRIVQVGYNLRFHPGLQKVKELLEDDEVGRILWGHVEVGQYLPDWRPGQDYRRSYTIRREFGGGIILEASHELDYATWLLGEPTHVHCVAGKVSDLEGDAEDCATVILRFANGAQVDVHMDWVQRGYTRSCKLAGERGTIIWDMPANLVRVYCAENDSWREFGHHVSIDDMYLSEVRHFLDCIARGSSPAVDLAQAARVLKIAVAAKDAVARGCTQVL